MPLRLARALVAAGEFVEAEKQLAAAEATDPFDWRVTWYRGVSLLGQGKPKEAQVAFDWLYGEATPQVRDYPTGAWGEEKRDDHPAVTVKPGGSGRRCSPGGPVWSPARVGPSRNCLKG